MQTTQVAETLNHGGAIYERRQTNKGEVTWLRNHSGKLYQAKEQNIDKLERVYHGMHENSIIQTREKDE